MTPPVVSVESPGEFSWALQATVKVHLGERGAHTATAGLWEEYVGGTGPAQGTVLAQGQTSAGYRKAGGRLGASCLQCHIKLKPGVHGMYM